MELRRSSVELLKSPYEATHISIYQYLQGADSKGTTVVPFQHLFRHGLQPSTGPRGIRQISNSRPFAAKQERYEDQPLRMMTRHRRGQLLIWDCDTRALIGSCPHGLNTTVCDFVPTSTHIFTRVECDAGKPNTGEDRCIFVWDPKTFALTDRLHGHNERVTSLAVEPSNPELLVSCSLDKDILIWDLSQRARVPKQRLDTSVIGMVLDMEIVDGHIVASGTVNSLGVWSLSTGNLESTTPPTVKESGCATMRPHPLTAERRKSLKSSSQQLTIFTGTVDGYVMEWGWDPVGKGPSNGSTTGDNIKQVWQSKSHTATVSLLIADEEVLFSGSTFDGGSLYHRLVGSRTHVGAEGEGCRSAVLDTYNKLLLMGSESGTIAAYNYAEFAVGNARNVTAVWEFRPHSSATSGLFLEVSHGNIWERFLSCSADGSVCIVDYRTERSMNTLSMDLMGPVSPFPGSLPVPRRKSLGPEVSISLISQSEAEPTKNVGPITCISYVESRCVLVVGTRDGRIRSYLCKTLKGGRIEWKQDREWTFAPNIPIHLSHPIGDDAAVFSVCFASDKAAGKNRTGGVALLVLDQPTIYTKITSPDLFPKRSTVHALNRFPAPWLGTKSPSARFALSLISRGGAVQIFTVHYGPPPVTVAKGEPKTPASPSTAPAWYIGECIMTIRPPTLGPLPTSTKPENLFSYRYQAEPSGAKPPGLVMTHSDAKAIHYSRLSALATKDDQRETFPSLDLKDASLPTTGVQQVILVCQSDVLAIARFADCPQAFVFAMDGTLSHIVEYNGSVTATDLSATLRKRKSLCLSLQSFLTTKRPANPCTFLAYSEECRAVLLVYGDGLLQLMDTSNKYIFSRHWMPDTPSSVRLTNKFIFAAAGLELCTFTIHPRIIVNEMADETAKPAKRS